MTLHKLIAPLILMALCSYSIISSATENGTTIIGSNESPTVLNVVPWKSKELSVDPWKNRAGPSSSVLNQVLEPLDRDELNREVQYFNILHGPEPASESK